MSDNNAVHTKPPIARFLKSKWVGRGPVNRVVFRLSALVLSRVATVLVIVIGTSADDCAIFRRERLDVYRLSIDYVARPFEASQVLEALHRHARNQGLRAAQMIPLNIAVGNGKRSLKDRARFLNSARFGSGVCFNSGCIGDD